MGGRLSRSPQAPFRRARAPPARRSCAIAMPLCSYSARAPSAAARPDAVVRARSPPTRRGRRTCRRRKRCTNRCNCAKYWRRRGGGGGGTSWLIPSSMSGLSTRCSCGAMRSASVAVLPVVESGASGATRRSGRANVELAAEFLRAASSAARAERLSGGSDSRGSRRSRGSERPEDTARVVAAVARARRPGTHPTSRVCRWPCEPSPPGSRFRRVATTGPRRPSWSCRR